MVENVLFLISLFLRIEDELTQTTIDTNTNMEQLKNKLSNKFNLKDKSFMLETFVLNKDYKIINSSNAFDIGYNISTNKSEKSTLETIKLFKKLKSNRA